MMTKNTMLYQEVVEITEDYLGPASKRFIDRQIVNHLDNKRPEDITESDLLELIDWIKAAIAILTEDKAMIEEFTSRLQKLMSNKQVAA